jgi:hypothetical protein
MAYLSYNSEEWIVWRTNKASMNEVGCGHEPQSINQRHRFNSHNICILSVQSNFVCELFDKFAQITEITLALSLA